MPQSKPPVVAGLLLDLLPGAVEGAHTLNRHAVLRDLGNERYLRAMKRLIDRSFLFLSHQTSTRSQMLSLYDEHFHNLISHPKYVGSKGLPRSFG